MNNLRVDMASEAARSACLALLGPVNSPDSVIFESRDANGTLAGAGGLLWQSWGQPPGFPAWVHVLPDRRRRGIGSAIARALIRHAEGEADSLWSARSLPHASPAASFAASNGFAEAGRQFVFKADAATFLNHIVRIVNHLKKRRRVPETSQTVVLSEELIDPVATLLVAELNTVPRDIAVLMARSLRSDPAIAPVDCIRSRVLLLDGKARGALLSRRQAGGCDSTILCNVVAPNLRRSWANAVLLESTTRAGIEDGCRHFQFDCAETSRDTIGLAKRCEAQLLRTEALYRYAMANDC
jgi:GNAT superfamily N-acetyltransferase